nr:MULTISPECIES: LD-carboxypeptidase [unclassified Roseofilum]
MHPDELLQLGTTGGLLSLSFPTNQSILDKVNPDYLVFKIMPLALALPPPLQAGDQLTVIAPSGPLQERQRFQAGLELWKQQGYQVKVDERIYDQWGYLAGKDGDRRAQLLDALHDPQCRGILCVRGGYGTTRLLEPWIENLPWKQYPKWLIGFSDITGLLWSQFYQGVGGGIHAPVLTTLSQEPSWSLERLWAAVRGEPLAALQGKGWGGDRTEGILLPGNLTVATHLLGTPLQPDVQGVILAWEDVGEMPYRIDRMLTQWRMSGLLSQVRGMALGRFSQCEPPQGRLSLTIEEVLGDRLSDLGIPIVSDLPFGHDGENGALPVGASVYLDAETGRLAFI